MFDFGARRSPRRPSLTPMIDVVFLLLVFFMLAAQFGHDGPLTLTGAGTGSGWDGPPRLIDISPDALALNGMAVAPENIAARLFELTQTPDDPIVLRPRDGATLQRLIDVAATLNAAGFARLAVVE